LDWESIKWKPNPVVQTTQTQNTYISKEDAHLGKLARNTEGKEMLKTQILSSVISEKRQISKRKAYPRKQVMIIIT
jgi:hypothetical protein